MLGDGDGSVGMSHTTPETDQIEALRAAHGQKWEFWTVGRVVRDGGTLWVARLRDDHMVMRRAHNAAELDRRVRKWKPGKSGET